MSITTRSGDAGTTGLMYNRRVSKCDPRVEAYGSVDELNAALGMARAMAGAPWVGEALLAIQKDLVVLMGELATAPPDLERYVKDGYRLITPDATSKLDRLIAQLESQKRPCAGWTMPGENAGSAALEVARTVCRRAERRVCALREADQLGNAEILVYLNRLSDAIWLLARWVEEQSRPRRGEKGGKLPSEAGGN